MSRFLLLSVLVLGLSAFNPGPAPAPAPTLKLALLKYAAGDWYANPTSLPNLAKFANENLGTNIDPDNAVVEVGSAELFNYPFVHMTGHGNVLFSDADAENLRNYLLAGGFLHVDDNYGIDPYIRVAMKKVFPDKEFVELPFQHPIFHQRFDFKNGLPKIYEHDGLPPQGFGIFVEDRLVCLYTFESDLGDGWEDPEVHKDPEELRQAALRMGANILQYVFGQ